MTDRIPTFSNFRVSLPTENHLVCRVACLMDGVIWLTGIRVVEGSKGPFMAMPSRKNAEGEFEDIFFPASRAIWVALEKQVLSAYAEAREVHQ